LSQTTHRDALIAYLHEKVEAGDWHGVSDAANDLRVLEAQIALTPMTTTEMFQKAEERYRRAHAEDSTLPLCLECIIDHTLPGGSTVYCTLPREHDGNHFYQQVKDMPVWARPWVKP
jgi:hypothetical protein